MAKWPSLVQLREVLMWISDIPPEMPLPEARIMCSVEAAERYQVPPDLVFAIALTEGGEPFIIIKAVT